ncbi:MAG TPA: hypothetical protein VFW87_22495 [Pirellulales bacterium]|nr:hypothetical protein [Pirellulales bacterium]
MIRRFQFSLRGLLLAIFLVCLGLSAWRIYAGNFATCVVAETARVGQPIRLKGRFSLKNGADSERFEIDVQPFVGGRRPMICYETSKWRALRNWGGVYRFAVPATCSGQSCWTKPGEYALTVLLPDGHYIAGRVSVRP